MPNSEIKIIKYGDPKKGAQKSIEQGNLELVMRVTAQAKTLSPFDTGSLRRSIMWKVPGQSGGLEEGKSFIEQPQKNSGLVGSSTEYAGYVEYGTRRQAAQPYLRPAVTIEVLGPNGANTMARESIKAMTESLNKGRKVFNG